MNWILTICIFLSFLQTAQADFKNSGYEKYLVPETHPYKPLLDAIFSQSRVTENVHAFAMAGFVTIASQETSFVKVAIHPQMPGVVFKVYLDSETRLKKEIPGWQWLLWRCENVEKMEKLFKKKKIKKFSLPKKWLYRLPDNPGTNGPIKQPVILMATDMQLLSHQANLEAWKTIITKEHLNELYTILSKGHGSTYVMGNIMLTENGKFAFIDTEYTNRKLKLEVISDYLSPEMKKYWEQLIR